MTALCAALEEARAARDLSWTELVAEIIAPFKFVPSIPISLSTIRGMGGKASATTGPAIGFPRVMRITQWLGRPAAKLMRGYAW